MLLHTRSEWINRYARAPPSFQLPKELSVSLHASQSISVVDEDLRTPSLARSCRLTFALKRSSLFIPVQTCPHTRNVCTRNNRQKKNVTCVHVTTDTDGPDKSFKKRIGPSPARELHGVGQPIRRRPCPSRPAWVPQKPIGGGMLRESEGARRDQGLGEDKGTDGSIFCASLCTSHVFGA